MGFWGVESWVGSLGVGNGWVGKVSLLCSKSCSASTTGEGTSRATALAWMASMCGWMYDSDAIAYGTSLDFQNINK